MSTAHNVPVTNKTSAHQLFPLLSRYTDPNGRQWIYAKAATDIAQYAAVGIDPVSGVAAALSKALADAGHIVAFAQIGFDGSPDAAYGWFMVGPNPTVLTGTGVLPGVPLYTTATAGLLDDASTGQTRIYGVRVSATIAGSNIGRACFVQGTPLT